MLFSVKIHHFFHKSQIISIRRREYNISPPANVTNVFRNWLNGIEKTEAQIRLGVCAFSWPI
jgi:hypothetical protein